jgi:hypothetical protein
MLAFLHRKANASNIQPDMFLKVLIHIYKITWILDMNKFLHYTAYVDSGTPEMFHRHWRSLVEISPELEKPQLRRYYYIM